MTGDKVRQVCEAMWPQEEIDALCKPFGVVERQRKLPLGMFVRARVISAGTPGGAYQADVLPSYLPCEVPPVARSACYRLFDAPLAHGAWRAWPIGLWATPGQQVDLAGPLCGVTDWSMVDATTVTVRETRCARSSLGQAATRRSRCIRSSRSAAGRRCSPIAVRPVSMTAAI